MPPASPERLLAALAADPGADVPATLAALVAWIRPRRGARAEDAIARIEALCALLRERREQRDLVRTRIVEWLARAHAVPLVAEAGVLSTRGFAGELVDRVYERLLPAPPRGDDLQDAFGAIFREPRDAGWVAGVPLGAWMGLVEALELQAPPGSAMFGALLRGLAAGARVLALRVAAEGSESELLRLAPEAALDASPFLALQREVARFLEAPADTGAALAAIPPCELELARLRAVSRHRGTTVRLTYRLERIGQQLARLAQVLRALDPADAGARRRAAFALFLELVRASATRRLVAPVWQANTRLLAQRVTENASRAGEHYATSTRAEYFAMMRAAMGAGVLIALMALVKIELKALHLPPLVEVLAVCADYAIGFVVIHLLHFTVATKQPAMTAATLAASIEDAHRGAAGAPGARPLVAFAALVASVTRTQIVAILGNLALALPVAAAIAWAVATASGPPLLPAQKSAALLAELHPFAGWALLHAAIAGVWLFVAGLVTGWYDNRCAILDIPSRLRGSPLAGWLPPAARERLANYVEGNLGALMGNAVFGCLLGGTAFVGFLVGLPIDIRHVAFAAANLGYAAVSSGLAPAAFAVALASVLLIGAVNLAVSFSLALAVALRSRGVTAWRAPALGAALLAYLVRHPREFVLPPRAP